MELTRIKSFHPDQMGPLFLGGNLPAEPSSGRSLQMFNRLRHFAHRRLFRHAMPFGKQLQ